MRRAAPSTPPAAAVARILVSVVVLAVLGYAYGLRMAAGDPSPVDHFGYFTNQTSLLLSIALLVSGATSLLGRTPSESSGLIRGIATTYLVVVGVVSNTLVPGTGSAPPWVSALLHVVLPVLAVLDWALVADRPPLPWRRLPLVLPYPLLWLVVVLVRGRTDGWVPYGFLLPANGLPSLIAYVLGLIAAVLVAGALIWVLSRRSGRRAGPRPA